MEFFGVLLVCLCASFLVRGIFGGSAMDSVLVGFGGARGGFGVAGRWLGRGDPVASNKGLVARAGTELG